MPLPTAGLKSHTRKLAEDVLCTATCTHTQPLHILCFLPGSLSPTPSSRVPRYPLRFYNCSAAAWCAVEPALPILPHGLFFIALQHTSGRSLTSTQQGEGQHLLYSLATLQGAGYNYSTHSTDGQTEDQLCPHQHLAQSHPVGEKCTTHPHAPPQCPTVKHNTAVASSTRPWCRLHLPTP